MRQSILVSGNNPQEFVDAYNETLAELSRATILRERQISDMSVLIFYETSEELDKKVDAVETDEPVDYTIELADPEQEETTDIVIKIVAPTAHDRFCCECDHYDWGKGCPFRDKHIKFMDHACRMFYVNIGGRY